ncbi:SpaA isopeptide-forming pilin-related protein [Faecalicatena fissicatena]|uniref:SpaA isopeptide-forming pilin-related protein n=1 Tax=Faecalicatena fissicatena TaxID=290055 RepID=UPI00195F52F7|nr:SpaA isopeptide-forming pilin-related protein [Faecalicatena fissicatena]
MFLFAALLGSSALQSRAEEDSPETDPGGGSEISWTLGRDSERVETDRLGVTEGGIMPRSAVGSLCTISYGGSHSYGSWFTREFYVAAETGNYTGYCVQPMSPPPSGTYQVSRLDNDVMKALLMMAPGYPYYEAYGKIIYNEADNNTYAYAHAALSYAYEGSLTGLSASMQAGVTNMVHYATAAVQGSWAPEIHENLDRYQVYIAYNDQQDIVWLEEQPKGNVQLQKVSAQTDITEGNFCYSLEGAVYGVYTDAGCTAQAGELVTDASGKSGLLSVNAGTYYVKEKTPPRGYALDGTVYRVDVQAGQTAQVSAKDIPQKNPVEVLLKKYDGELDFQEEGNAPQGAASLAGAEFTFRFYTGDYDSLEKLEGVSPARTWVFRSDDRGFVSTQEEYFVEGDPVWRDGNGGFFLPLGTVTIQETKAPQGYNLNSETQLVRVTPEGTGEQVQTYQTPAFEEDVIRGDLELIKVYQNEEEKEDVLEGIEGVEFTLTSRTTGQEVLRIVTDREGKATTRSEDYPRGRLVYDTYLVTETKTPEGYNPVKPFEVEISEENVTVSGIYRQDTLITSPIQVLKVDASTGKTIPAAGTEFQLLDADRNVVTMTSHYPEYQVYETFVTDEEGRFTFPEKLKYGTYYLREVKAPKGYLLNGEELAFTVEEDKDWGSPLTVRFADENAMGRISIDKYEEGKEEYLAGTEFEIQAAEDIVTPDGTVRLKKGELAGTLTTGNETAVSEELFLGKYTVRETRQVPGFALPEKAFQVELKYKDQTTPVVEEHLTVYNEPTSLVLLKYEKGSEEKTALAGVRFKVWLKQDEAVEEEAVMGEDTVTEEDAVDPGYTLEEIYETDEEGRIEIPYLLPDSTYCIQEAETLPGYIPDGTVHEVYVDAQGRIEGGAVCVMKFENDYTKLRVSKLDGGNRQYLPGAGLKLERVLESGERELVESWTSGKEEKKFDRLEPGEYVLTEEQAPEGYEKAEPVSFTLKETGEEQKVEMLDQLLVKAPRTGDISYIPWLGAALAGSLALMLWALRIRKRK